MAPSSSTPSGPSAGAPPEVIVLRPLGNPLPLGLVGFSVGAFVASAPSLGWIPRDQHAVVAAVLLAFAAPLQLMAASLGFLARDATGATAQGVLAATWGTFGVMLLVPGGGATSAGVGVFWLAAAFVVGTLAIASWSAGRFFSAILTVSSARYLLEGIAGLGGARGVSFAAGLVGLLQAALASYAALALLLEHVKRVEVLPLVRSTAAERAIEQSATAGIERAAHDPGVRSVM